jgi:predicted GNAT family N-acyltransferase
MQIFADFGFVFGSDSLGDDNIAHFLDMKRAFNIKDTENVFSFAT